MKFYKFFAIVLVLLPLVSCVQLEDDLSDDPSNGSGNEEEVEVFPTNVEKKEYGQEFYLSILPDINPIAY